MGNFNERVFKVMETLFIGATIVLSVVLGISLYFNYQHALIILRMVDEVEDAIGILDSKHESISEILEIPLFYDSPQIRQVHNDINDCRDSVLRVASMLGNIEEDEAELTT